MTPHPNETPEPLAQEQAGEMAVVAYLVTNLSSGEPSICFEDERGDYGDEDHMPVFEALCRLSDHTAELQAKDAEIAGLKAELRDREAHLFEARKLLDERPAINAGLFEAYSKWTGKVYSLDWLNAVDAAAIRAQTGGEG